MNRLELVFKIIFQKWQDSPVIGRVTTSLPLPLFPTGAATASSLKPNLQLFQGDRETFPGSSGVSACGGVSSAITGWRAESAAW